jgi:ATP-dependent exoDNAse (exonuclease V) alpha subunit
LRRSPASSQGAELAQLERATSSYLRDGSVVPLGRVDQEHRFATRELLACEWEIVDGVERRASERTAMLHPRVPDLTLADQDVSLSHEQLETVRALATDGRGVSILQALAGTGKTRVLAALAQVYAGAGYRVIGLAPTARAARELGDAAGIPAYTIQRLLLELRQTGGLAARTVLLFDEAGSAPTRPTAELLDQAGRARAKVIASGDPGQLPSVAAGGWFAAIADRLDGPQLREVMRQRDRSERAMLELVHDGEPTPYIELKRSQEALAVHEHERDAIATVLHEWDKARRAHGLSQAVMIARDNATREILNDGAREILSHDRALADDGVIIADREFRVGDRVIARRNDRHRDIDNGTLGIVGAIDRRTGELTIITDTGQRRRLDASYAAEHLEHAYALTGHGAQGATVEWAAVIGRPSEFTREWAYTALSRARGQTQLHVIAATRPSQRERKRYAPPEPERTATEALQTLVSSMRRREGERLAIEVVEPQALAAANPTAARRVPLAEFPEVGAEQESSIWRSPSELSSGPSHLHWEEAECYRGIER